MLAWCLDIGGTFRRNLRAVEDYRTPRRWRAFDHPVSAPASWSAPAFWRFATETRRSFGDTRLASLLRHHLSVALGLALCAAVGGFAAQPAGPGQPAEARHRFRAGAASSNVSPRLGTSIDGYFTDRRAEPGGGCPRPSCAR